MKIKYLCSLAVTLAILIVNIAAATPLTAATENYQLKMWIAPMECTRNEVINGVDTAVIITPEECDELLNPPSGPVGSPSQPVARPVPNAPDTGAFGDIWTTLLGASMLLVILGGVLYILWGNVLSDYLRKRVR